MCFWKHIWIFKQNRKSYEWSCYTYKKTHNFKWKWKTETTHFHFFFKDPDKNICLYGIFFWYTFLILSWHWCRINFILSINFRSQIICANCCKSVIFTFFLKDISISKIYILSQNLVCWSTSIWSKTMWSLPIFLMTTRY